MKHSSELSIIITAFNEEKNISPFFILLKDFMQHQGFDYEVLFVDDGSSDQTYAEAKKFSEWQNLKIIKLSKNRGSGCAIKEAMKHATAEWYAWLPCDLEILPEELFAPLNKRLNQDIVVTYFATGQTARSWKRRFLSKSFTVILNFCFGQKLPYYNGLSLIKCRLVRETNVLSNGFFFHAELLIRVLAKSQKITCVPINLSPRHAEKAKAISFKVLKDVIRCFVRTFWEVKLVK